MQSESEIMEALKWVRRLGSAIELATELRASMPLDGDAEGHALGPFLPTPKSKAAAARKRLAGRRLRDRFFDHGLFVEPAWDMMLDLYAAHYERKRISVSSLTIASNVPATTALRWIDRLVDSGQLIKQPDLSDRRKVYVTLAPDVIAKLDAYFLAEHEINRKFSP